MATKPGPVDSVRLSPWVQRAKRPTGLPERVCVYDVTLRDGEQYPGLVFTREDKVRLALALDELGLDRFEAGMPAVSQDDQEALRAICKRVKAHVVAFCRGMLSDVDLALDAGAWGVTVELPASRRLIETGYNWALDDVVRRAVETCNYATKKGLHTTFFMIDSSGAEPTFLRSLIQRTVMQTDIDALAAVDTFGRLHPRATSSFVKAVRKWSGVPVEIHVHNDFGLGLANSLVALEAGAEVVHTNMLGLGERSGGVPTEQMLLVLELMYGIETGVDLSKLRDTALLFETVSGVKMPGHTPVVGDNSFSYEAGVAAMFSYRFFAQGEPLGALAYLPELVGNEFRIVLGKKAGKYNVLWHMERLGIESCDDETIREIVERVKATSIAQKRAITEEEFRSICRAAGENRSQRT